LATAGATSWAGSGGGGGGGSAGDGNARPMLGGNKQAAIAKNAMHVGRQNMALDSISEKSTIRVPSRAIVQ